jgi:hypothetical protein
MLPRAPGRDHPSMTMRISDVVRGVLATSPVVILRLKLAGKFSPPLRHVEQHRLVSGVRCLQCYADAFGCIACVVIGSRHLLSP